MKALAKADRDMLDMNSLKWFAALILSALLTTVGMAASGEPGKSGLDPDRESTSVGSGRVWASEDGSPLPFDGDDEILDFLATADVVASKKIGEGLNQTLKVTLERDGIRMHAAFRQFRGRRYFNDAQQGREIPVRDDFAHEAAAYRLSRMLGVDLVPPTVVREVDGKAGSMQAWVENAMMEKERRAKDLNPPDEWLWMARMLTMHLFDNLIANTDRHQGNLLVDPAWNVWLIDHTQAFRPIDYLFAGDKVLYCDRDVWRRLKDLDQKQVEEEFEGLVGKSEIKALFRRRDRLVKQLQKLIDQNGADRILFSLSS